MEKVAAGSVINLNTAMDVNEPSDYSQLVQPTFKKTQRNNIKNGSANMLIKQKELILAREDLDGMSSDSQEDINQHHVRVCSPLARKRWSEKVTLGGVQQLKRKGNAYLDLYVVYFDNFR